MTPESDATRRPLRAPSTLLEQAIAEFLDAAYETREACWEAPTSILDLASPTPRLDFESSHLARLLVARAIELRRAASEANKGLASASVTHAARASLDAVQLVVQEDGSAWFDMAGSPSASRQRQLSAMCGQATKLLRSPFERLLQDSGSPDAVLASPDWLTVSQAAYVTGLSPSYISKLCKRNKLKHHGHWRQRRIPAAALREFLVRRDKAQDASPRTLSLVQFNRRMLEITEGVGGMHANEGDVDVRR